MEKNEVLATGRRKRSIARVRLTPNGDGTVLCNGHSPDDYFPTPTMKMRLMLPLVLTEKIKNVSIKARLNGGGKSAQADALRHGISRALLKMDESLRPILKREGFLTRDPREKERKKYGQPGARKRFQFSKR